ncbi:MAG TPA: glycosyltransferase family 2 protein [Pyrinomonadaceae bacterium]|nr:glycosyltransferase family 2 protein [Pyrinomonadaceae bacterium]
MLVFYFLAALVLLQSILSLRGGVRYLSYFRRELDAKRPLYMPFASVIVPCRGLDQGLHANLSALFAQLYPVYEIVFVSDRAADPAFAVAEEVHRRLGGESAARVRFVVAGRARESGQKVHNLRAAVCETNPASEVFVFVDTDARPRADWLRSLVAPLEDEGAGATTGYRWFLPVSGGFASHLRSVWNASIASALGANTARNFCWGGSTAIRRETFERLGMSDLWRGTLSDDFALTRALQNAKLPVRFVPNCLTASHEDCSFRELVEFTTRQLKITRVYAPQLWKIVLVSNLLFVVVFYGGLLLAVVRAAAGRSFEWPLVFVVAVFLLGTWKAFFRLRAVALALDGFHRQLRAGLWPHLLLWPLTSALYLYNALAALWSRRITWRGITYELKSPTETAIISGQDSHEEIADEAEERTEARHV